MNVDKLAVSFQHGHKWKLDHSFTVLQQYGEFKMYLNSLSFWECCMGTACSWVHFKNKVTSAVAAVVFLVVSIIVHHQWKICSGIRNHSSIDQPANAAGKSFFRHGTGQEIILMMMMMMKTMITTLMFRKPMQLRLREYHTLHAYVRRRMMKCVRGE